MKRKNLIRKKRVSEFANRHNEIELFSRFLSGSLEDTAILYFWGSIGIGKSTLLYRFQEICTEKSIPYVYIELPERLRFQPVDFIAQVFQQSAASSPQVPTPKLAKQIERYKKLESKVIKSLQEKSGKIINVATKITKAGLSLTPLGPLSTLMDIVGDDLIESGIRALYEIFNNPGDIECYVNPLPFFTSALLDDWAFYPGVIVIMIDNYEMVSEDLDFWLRESIIPETEQNVLFVLAGRDPSLSKNWYEWQDIVRKIALQPLEDRFIRELLSSKGIADETTHDIVIDYCAGNPYILSLAIDLLHRSAQGAQILQKQRAQIISSIIRQLSDEILSTFDKNTRQVIECCSIVRFFTEEILNGLTHVPDIQSVFDKVISLSFVRPNPKGVGYVLDPFTRLMLLEELRERSPKRYAYLHARAVSVFEDLIETVGIYSRDTYRLEKLYHLLRIDEEKGLAYFEDIFVHSIRVHNLQLCEELLLEVEDPELQFASKTAKYVIQYCKAELARRKRNLSQAQQLYEQILEIPFLDSLTKLKVLSGLTLLLRDITPQSAEKYCVDGMKIWKDIAPSGAKYAVQIFHDYADILRDTGRVTDSLTYYQQSIKLSREYGYKFGEMDSLHGYGIALQSIGQFGESLKKFHEALGLSREIHDENAEGAILNNMAVSYMKMGDYTSAERCIQEAIPLLEKWGNEWGVVAANYRLAQIYHKTHRLDEALLVIDEGLELLSDKGSIRSKARALTVKGAILVDLQDYSEARRLLDKAIELSCSHQFYNLCALAKAHRIGLQIRTLEIIDNEQQVSAEIENVLEMACRHSSFLLYEVTSLLIDEVKMLSEKHRDIACLVLEKLTFYFRTLSKEEDEFWEKATNLVSNLKNSLASQ